MGSLIEINDTLKISKERGFPQELSLPDHQANPETTFPKVLNRRFQFWNNDERLYHRPPTRVFLVQEMGGGQWLYWGHALIHKQTIEHGRTFGEYEIIKIYDPQYQQPTTINEAPQGKSYFTI